MSYVSDKSTSKLRLKLSKKTDQIKTSVANYTNIQKECQDTVYFNIFTGVSIYLYSSIKFLKFLI
jgi:hypothetical protein